MNLITDAVVLKIVNYQEADRMVTLLTREHGKISALALGARRSNKRFGAALSLFGYGEASLKSARNGNTDLWILQELHSSGKGFSTLGYELRRFSQASYACELCYELCSPNQPETQILDLLLTFLHYLNDLPISQHPAMEPVRVFELNLLEHVGLRLALLYCAVCGNKIDEDQTNVVLDVNRGGILCKLCSTSIPIAKPNLHFLSAAAYQALLLLTQQQLGSESLRDLQLARSVSLECRSVLIDFIQYHIGKKLRTVEFAEQFA